MLRPMANLFAVADPDPQVLNRIEEGLDGSKEFDAVWRPAPGWLVAQAMMPDSDADGERVRSVGLAFAEGRDRLEDGQGLDALNRVAELADSSPDRLAELPGDFGFLRFQPDGTLLAVRSCGGRVPVYLQPRGDRGFAVGTLLSYFPRFLPERLSPDALVNATWVRIYPASFIDDRTFVDGVSILPRGSYAEVGSGRAPLTGRYWDPRPDDGEGPDPSLDHHRELRRILIESLERDLDPEGRNVLMLSGGVDSSALGALIAGTLGVGLSSWSMIPAVEPGRSLELSYIDPLVSDFGIQPARKHELTEELHRGWISAAPGLPFQVLHPALCDLPNLCAEEDVRTIVSGMFADEICGDTQRLNDWALHTSLRSLLSKEPLPFGRRDYKLWAKRRLREAVGRPRVPAGELDGWVPPEVEGEYRGWIHRCRSALTSDHRPLRELAARASGDAWVAMYWEAAAPLGVRPSLPFFNREVLELAFRCHPRELLGPGPKRLLREALSDDVPARNLLRPDRGMWTGHHARGRWALDGALPAAADDVVRSDWVRHPPADVPFMEGYRLTAAIRVAESLRNAGSLMQNSSATFARPPVSGIR
jgi:asparagine synthetase B (glutamine-hydrolysing)